MLLTPALQWFLPSVKERVASVNIREGEKLLDETLERLTSPRGKKMGCSSSGALGCVMDDLRRSCINQQFMLFTVELTCALAESLSAQI